MEATRTGGKTKASSGLMARAISTGCHIRLDGRDEGGKVALFTK